MDRSISIKLQGAAKEPTSKSKTKVEEESEEEDEANQTIVTFIDQPNRYYLIDPFLRPAICSILIG